MNTNKELLPIGKTIDKRWRIVEKIGAGACGTVYKVADRRRDGYSAALKVEFHSDDDPTLLFEVNALRAMSPCADVLRMLDCGRRKTYTYLVTSLCGRDLMALRVKNERGFESSTALRVSVFLLYGLKQLHDAGFVHRDVKPGNVMTASRAGRDARRLLLIDFGMARSIVVTGVTGQRKLRPPRENSGVPMRGTVRYCSMNVHERREQGRHDDLIAMLHAIVAVTTGLPWHKLREEKETEVLKRATRTVDLFRGLPDELKTAYEYLHTLTYSDRPDYEKMYHLMMSGVRRHAVTFLDPFEWEDEQLAKRRRRRSSSSSSSENGTPEPEPNDLSTAIDYDQSELLTKKALPKEKLQFQVYPLLRAQNFSDKILPF